MKVNTHSAYNTDTIVIIGLILFDMLGKFRVLIIFALNFATFI